MKLPVDFEQKVKLPPQVNGVSYPYRISAKDLMDDFKYAALQVDDNEVNGLQLVETIGLDGTRTVSLSGESNDFQIDHPFQVELNYNKTEWECSLGTVYDVNNNTYFTTNIGKSSELEGHFILKITRDETTRAVTDAEIIFDEYQIESTSTYQYISLATVETNAEDGVFYNYGIRQKVFEDIYVNEELVVVNGEFRLQVYLMAHRNNYELPI